MSDTLALHMKNIPSRQRRGFLQDALTLSILSSVGVFNAAFAADNGREFRVGWQKGSNLAILKARGNLDAHLKREGWRIKWVEFTAGPQMLEGLNVGSIDFACVGETPPIFAQAAGADLRYVASEPPAPRAEKILVPGNSAIRSVSELKGKRVALNRGSNVHYQIVKALERAGLKYADVDIKLLPPSDARAAFENGTIDAWVIWDPFAEAAIGQIGARVLETAEGVALNYNFYLSTGDFTRNRSDVLQWAIEEIKATDDWVQNNFDAAADILAPQISLSREITRNALRNYSYGVAPLDARAIGNQQTIADTFTELKLIPKKLDVASVVWKPPA
ncbi:aliphatic sulfonate ABC transporter substrate-binding protein [Bordetella genomosp. 10]|nr:aliphatic sulfonate ABC transporter substrate-binding protein [Bordetella genomosp. 10]